MAFLYGKQKELQHEQEKRAADRQGRIKAEQALKHLRLQLALTPQQPAALASNPQQPAVEQDGASQQPSGNKVDSEAAAPLPSFPFTAIGTLRSCFSNRLVRNHMLVSSVLQYTEYAGSGHKRSVWFPHNCSCFPPITVRHSALHHRSRLETSHTQLYLSK